MFDAAKFDAWLQAKLKATESRTVKDLHAEFVRDGLRCTPRNCRGCLVAMWLRNCAVAVGYQVEIIVGATYAQLFAVDGKQDHGYYSPRRSLPMVLQEFVVLFDDRQLPEFDRSGSKTATQRRISEYAYHTWYGDWTPPNARLEVLPE